MTYPVGGLPPVAYARPPRAVVRAERDRQRLPQEPARYQQLLRGPGRRWWKPLLSLLLFAVLVMVLGTAGFLAGSLLDLATGRVDLDSYLASDNLTDTPGGFLGLNLALAACIPAAGLATWIVHRVRPGYVSSVAGRIRWAWMARCLLVTAPVWAVLLSVSILTSPEPLSAPPPDRLALIVVVLLTTPLQCAGEEFAFRGWVLQNVGAWFAKPVVAFVAGTIVASSLFALAHGSLDPWILADLAVFSAAACVLAWRTGGLEAGIAVHTINNVGLMVTTLIIGGWSESFVGTETTGDPLQFAMSAAAQAAVVALVLWQARRADLERVYRPAPAPAPYAGWGPPSFGPPMSPPDSALWSPIPGAGAPVPPPSSAWDDPRL